MPGALEIPGLVSLFVRRETVGSGLVPAAELLELFRKLDYGPVLPFQLDLLQAAGFWPAASEGVLQMGRRGRFTLPAETILQLEMRQHLSDTQIDVRVDGVVHDSWKPLRNESRRVELTAPLETVVELEVLSLRPREPGSETGGLPLGLYVTALSLSERSAAASGS
jgi:hypothetical protein